VLERFTDDALQAERGRAARVLEGLGLTLAPVREQVRRIIGPVEAPPGAHVLERFTVRPAQIREGLGLL
jgi:hypothetical protein